MHARAAPRQARCTIRTVRAGRRPRVLIQVDLARETTKHGADETAVEDARTGCADVDGAFRCVPGREVAAEEPFGFRRAFELAEADDYGADLRVRPRPGDPLNRLLLESQPIGISASSQANPDSRASAIAAIDGDPGTSWTADLDDLKPVIEGFDFLDTAEKDAIFYGNALSLYSLPALDAAVGAAR